MNTQRNGDTPTERSLSPKQQLALEQLLLGKNVTETAAAAEIDRTTVHRWLKEDIEFRAAYNRGRRELQDALDARLLQVAEQALDTVEQAVKDGDVRAALAVLKGLGLLSGERFTFASDDPQTLKRSDESQELQEVILERMRRRTMSAL